MMRYESEDGNIQIALTGDALVTRRMSVYKEPHFLQLVEMLRAADVTITNAEMLFHDFEDSPSPVGMGSLLRADPKIIDELQWMGINMIAAANNHGYDYGENGLVTHLHNLRKSGVVHAGIGETLGEAREPHYLDTRNGRVALISCTSSGSPNMMAAHQWRDGKGRPGANYIRHTTRFTVDESSFETLKKIRDSFDLTRGLRNASAQGKNHSWGMTDIPDSDTDFFLGSFHTESQLAIPAGFRIGLGDHFERHLIPVAHDIEENLQRIHDARRSADWVIVTMHSHEQGLTDDDPSNIAVTFAHAAIDAGADVFHGHGPHRDRGIEIYKGKPIFYSIGHLINQQDEVSKVPHEVMARMGLNPWESTPSDFYDGRAGAEWKGEHLGHTVNPDRWRDIIAIVDFKNKELSGITLQPIELGAGRPRYQRGRPLIASSGEAQGVLNLFQDLSKPFGTEITIEGDVGKVVVGR